MRISASALALVLAGVAAPALAQQITGAGSTFAAPIYAKWGEAAKGAIGVELNYQAIGSGAGQNQVFNRTVDFGASDAPVPADKLQAHHLLQFPTVMGGVAVIANIPNVKPDELKLTGDVLAGIYLGNITKWNDPKVATLNPGLKLPNLAIAPVYRADGSGTTFVFTDYLSMIDPAWKGQVGSSTSVRWLAGTGARGSDGVAAVVRQVRGGLGYVESTYAALNHLATAELRNAAGKFVKPEMASFQAAATNANWSKVRNFAIDLNNQPGDASWPIVSATFVLVPLDAKPAVLKFFDWGLRDGDQIARDLQYVTLPATVKAAVRAAWKSQASPK